jgi:hypothetical protein
MIPYLGSWAHWNFDPGPQAPSEASTIRRLLPTFDLEQEASRIISASCIITTLPLVYLAPSPPFDQGRHNPKQPRIPPMIGNCRYHPSPAKSRCFKLNSFGFSRAVVKRSSWLTFRSQLARSRCGGCLFR